MMLMLPPASRESSRSMVVSPSPGRETSAGARGARGAPRQALWRGPGLAVRTSMCERRKPIHRAGDVGKFLGALFKSFLI